MNSKKSGFTLVEIMMVLMIFSVFIIGAMAFYIQVTKGIYVSAQRLQLGASIRKFTDEMVHNASRANECILYISSTSIDRDDATSAHTDRQIILTNPDPIQHPAGNFVVFVYYNFPTLPGQTKHTIKKIIGYYSVINASTGVGPVRKVEITPNAANSVLEVETVLANYWTATTGGITFSDFLLNVRGLIPSETITTGYGSGPSLFYMNDQRAITVSGQIFQSNASINTKDWKTYTESFNFVVTPRT